MTSEERHERLIEAALQSEELWSLAQDGRLIRYRLEGGSLALPLWPSQEAAALESPDASEQPVKISLQELLESILPELASQGGLVANFPIKGESYVIEPPALLERLWKEWDEDE